MRSDRTECGSQTRTVTDMPSLGIGFPITELIRHVVII